MTVAQKGVPAGSRSRDDTRTPSTTLIADRQHPGARVTYESAVANGFYEKDLSGLHGKFDNVRRHWEDQITRHALRGFVVDLAARKRRDAARIRVLDLGAGSGEGYEILTSLRSGGEDLASRPSDVLPPELLSVYQGIDISQAMVAQGRKIHFDNPAVDFKVGDLSRGLEAVRTDLPYDLYYSSYGSLSHLDDDELERLVSEIYDHFADNCIFVADLLGRFSFEWQCYWQQPDLRQSRMRHYSMSYLYRAEMRDRVAVERFPVRYWGGDEFDRFMTRVIQARGGRVTRKLLWDRSVLVGRHMNTGEFNSQARPIRDAVNRLHAYYYRTDLRSLLFDYAPQADFPALNEFFGTYQDGWNAVVNDTIEALERSDDDAWLSAPPPADQPDAVRDAMRTMRNVIRNAGAFSMDDPRANVVEPQLGYALRNLEMRLQQGLGAGHGLLAIYQLEKD